MLGPYEVRTRMLQQLKREWKGPLEDFPAWDGPPAMQPVKLNNLVVEQCFKEQAAWIARGMKAEERLIWSGPWHEAHEETVQDAGRRHKLEKAQAEGGTSNGDAPLAMITNPKATLSSLRQNAQQFSSVTLPQYARQLPASIQKQAQRMMQYAGANLARMDAPGALRKVAVVPR